MAYASCAFDVSADRVRVGLMLAAMRPTPLVGKDVLALDIAEGLEGLTKGGEVVAASPIGRMRTSLGMAGGSLVDGLIAGAGRSDEAITLVRQAMRESFGYPAHTILALEDLPSLCLLPFVYQVRNDIVDERFVFGSDPCTREIDESYFSFNALRLVFLKDHGEALGPGHASEVNHREIERVDPEYPSLVFLTLVRARVNNRPDPTSRGIVAGDPKLQVAGQRASLRSERVRIRKTEVLIDVRFAFLGCQCV